MKSISTLILLVALTASVTAQSQFAASLKPTVDSSAGIPLFKWDETSFDFGKVALNTPVTHEFSFINSGSAPLVISSVQVSCGCTVTDYTKDPIEPGSTGFVKATYNAASGGIFTKTVTINANTEDGVVTLRIAGEVIK